MNSLHHDLQELKTLIDWRLEDDDENSFFRLQSAFRELVFESAFLSDSINAQLDDILKRPLEASPHWMARNIVAIAEPNWQLHYGIASHTSEFIRSNISHGLIAVIGPDPLIVDHYRTSKTIDTDVYDAGISLLKPRREVYEPGSICVVDARDGVASFIVDTPTTLVTLLGPPRRAIQWIFSRQTLRAVQSIPSNPADTEMAIMIRALTAMRCTTSIATLCALTTHESHFVRWTALQALVELSPEAAKSSLQRATKDVHPHVRMASAKAIAAMAA
ncbi:MAG: HEAT repeat domain-containing protein [Rudaea sp.]